MHYTRIRIPGEYFQIWNSNRMPHNASEIWFCVMLEVFIRYTNACSFLANEFFLDVNSKSFALASALTHVVYLLDECLH